MTDHSNIVLFPFGACAGLIDRAARKIKDGDAEMAAHEWRGQVATLRSRYVALGVPSDRVECELQVFATRVMVEVDRLAHEFQSPYGGAA